MNVIKNKLRLNENGNKHTGDIMKPEKNNMNGLGHVKHSKNTIIRNVRDRIDGIKTSGGMAELESLKEYLSDCCRENSDVYGGAVGYGFISNTKQKMNKLHIIDPKLSFIQAVLDEIGPISGTDAMGADTNTNKKMWVIIDEVISNMCGEEEVLGGSYDNWEG